MTRKKLAEKVNSFLKEKEIDAIVTDESIFALRPSSTALEAGAARYLVEARPEGCQSLIPRFKAYIYETLRELKEIEITLNHREFHYEIWGV